MTTQKAGPAKTPTTGALSTTTGTPPATTRKSWIKKTPVEVVLEQIGKQEEKVSEMRTDLTREERELAKLQKAKAVLEAV